MPEVTLEIGGRSFIVACQDGEEPTLQQAAGLLNVEAEALQSAIGRVPENRMLLMAGLMLADRTAELAEKAAAAQEDVGRLTRHAAALEARATELASRAEEASDGVARRDYDAAVDALSRAAERAERLGAG